jgi:hypothetical protein
MSAPARPCSVNALVPRFCSARVLWPQLMLWDDWTTRHAERKFKYLSLLGVGLATVFDPLKTVQATASEVRFYLLDNQ